MYEPVLALVEKAGSFHGEHVAFVDVDAEATDGCKAMGRYCLHERDDVGDAGEVEAGVRVEYLYTFRVPITISVLHSYEAPAM